MTSWQWSYSAQCLVRQWLWEMTSWQWSYSAQCLVRQWLWEMTSWQWSYSAQCLVRHWIYGAASLRGHSTGAAYGQGCHALIQRCITVEVPQLQFLFKVVNIPVGVQRQLPWSHFSETIEILLLQYIDKVVHVGCASPASSLVQSVRRQSRSHSCSFDAGHSHACRCATTGAWAGRDSAETVRVPQLTLSLGQVDDMPAGVSSFWGRVHRHTARADPRHQGGEVVAGTPGACSQVFCRPSSPVLLRVFLLVGMLI